MTARIRITLVKSPIGYSRRQKGTVRALGLRKMHQTVVKNDDPAIRGMIRAIAHMVEYEEMN